MNENPTEGWHLTKNITPCKECGATTEFMYPLFGMFLCEKHREKIMGMPLCCSNCFEPYWPSYPERTSGGKDKWTGHCRDGRGCCHDRDRKAVKDNWRKEGDGVLKKVELSISGYGNPMITIDTERNHYTIYWKQDVELFRAFADKSDKFVNHFKLQREVSSWGDSEAIDLVSFFNGTRDVTEHRPFTDHIGHELKIPPHVEGYCNFGCYEKDEAELDKEPV